MVKTQEENLRKDAESYYEKEDRIGQFLAKQRNMAALKHIKGLLIDLGAGDGLLLKSYSGKGIGVDISDYGDTDVLLENFNHLPFDDGYADTVTIVGSLNYFEQPVQVLKEVKRILKDDGQLVITMPNVLIMKVWHKFREPWAHKSGYSYEKIKTMMRLAGLTIEKRQAFLGFLNYVYIIKKAG